MKASQPRPVRARRTVLAVPGSSQRFIAKSRELPVDALFLDLEDAVAPAAKAQARGTIVAALNEGGWDGPAITVRVNDWDSPWTTLDVLEVVGGAGGHIDAIVLPKVRSAEQVIALDMVLGQAEASAGLRVGRIGLEVQIEDAQGLAGGRHRRRQPGLETLVFGPGDFMASMGMRGLSVGSQIDGYDSDAFHYVLARIWSPPAPTRCRPSMGLRVDPRPVGLPRVGGQGGGAGLRRQVGGAPVTGRGRQRDLHPGRPAGRRAERIIAAYARATDEAGGAVGAIVVDDEMVDEAGVKVAHAILAKAGRG